MDPLSSDHRLWTEPSYLAESQQGSTSVFSYINIFIYVHKRF